MTRMTGPDCVVMCNLINTHTHTHTKKITTIRLVEVQLQYININSFNSSARYWRIFAVAVVEFRLLELGTSTGEPFYFSGQA